MWEAVRDNFASGIPGFFAGIILGLLSLYWFGSWETSEIYRKEAIERGYAQYCPLSGNWAWEGECK